MDEHNNRRGAVRYIRHDRLFVQILSASESTDFSSRTVYCHSCDASASGMRVEMDTEVAVNSQVDLWAAFDGLDTKYYLRGHVCWCYEMAGESANYQVGIELEDAYATDYADWVALISSFSEEYNQPLS